MRQSYIDIFLSITIYAALEAPRQVTCLPLDKCTGTSSQRNAHFITDYSLILYIHCIRKPSASANSQHTSKILFQILISKSHAVNCLQRKIIPKFFSRNKHHSFIPPYLHCSILKDTLYCQKIPHHLQILLQTSKLPVFLIESKEFFLENLANL